MRRRDSTRVRAGKVAVRAARQSAYPRMVSERREGIRKIIGHYGRRDALVVDLGACPGLFDAAALPWPVRTTWIDRFRFPRLAVVADATAVPIRENRLEES